MAQVRILARILFYLARAVSILSILIAVYALLVLGISAVWPGANMPIARSAENNFVIFYPFTKIPFLLGEYNISYLATTFLALTFYILFLWMLSDVFHAFKQERIFSRKGVLQLTRFYLVNLMGPLLIMLVLVAFRQEIQDIIRITFLHLIIGVFAFFMSAIFKQGVILQEEQDLIF